VTQFLLPNGEASGVAKVRMRGNISTPPPIPPGKLLAITKTISYTPGVGGDDVTACNSDKRAIPKQEGWI